MMSEKELKEINAAFRQMYWIFPDGDVYEKLSFAERIIERVLED